MFSNFFQQQDLLGPSIWDNLIKCDILVQKQNNNQNKKHGLGHTAQERIKAMIPTQISAPSNSWCPLEATEQEKINPGVLKL